jgi:hypothetical protein
MACNRDIFTFLPFLLWRLIIYMVWQYLRFYIHVRHVKKDWWTCSLYVSWPKTESITDFCNKHYSFINGKFLTTPDQRSPYSIKLICLHGHEVDRFFPPSERRKHLITKATQHCNTAEYHHLPGKTKTFRDLDPQSLTLQSRSSRAQVRSAMFHI